jgi:UDP:flavonoid glycosyltransferase YjiC (YdhE family)
MERCEYSLPDNVVMLPTAPQIQILQRASLFITHCGMNSTSEAIYHGVPIIGLPLCVDQPMVAQRVCDELQLGIRLDHTQLDHCTLRRAMHRILSSHATYAQRVGQFSRISRNYNGAKLSAVVVDEFLGSSPSPR